MRFFNYEKCYLLSLGDPDLLIQYFWDLEEGYDFIVNEDAIRSMFVSSLHKAEYLGLCALRNYENYKNENMVNLSRDLIPPWVPIEQLTDNPLIELTATEVKLLKEN